MIFPYKSIYSGFTLIELMVAITLITILAIGITNIDLSSYSQKQEWEIENNKIISLYETLRNNALFGKWIDTNTTASDAWKLTVQTTPYQVSAWYSQSGSWLKYEGISQKPLFTIDTLSCHNIDSSLIEDSPSQIDIIFRADRVSLDGCTANSSQKLQIHTSYSWKFKKVLEVHTISSLIEIK